MTANPATHITASTCCYCGVGCGVLIEHDGEQILGVKGHPQHPATLSGKQPAKKTAVDHDGCPESHQE